MTVTDGNRPRSPAEKFMVMLGKEIGAEFYIVHMIAFTDENSLPGYSRKTVIMRIFFPFGKAGCLKPHGHGFGIPAARSSCLQKRTSHSSPFLK